MSESHIRQEVLETQARLSALGMLVSGIAHEIANPIGFIKSNLQYALERINKAIGEEGRDGLLQEIAGILAESLEGIQRVTEITNEVRRVARARSEVAPVDVEEAMEKALLLVHNTLKYKANVVKSYNHPPPVVAEEGPLVQVFVNLLVNAAQAIPERGEITVETRLRDDYVEVSVKDTGCGIPKEVRAHLFEPFFTTKPPGVGTGLGLWMVRRIVEPLGGHIEVESEGGKGATFRVLLPKAKGL